MELLFDTPPPETPATEKATYLKRKIISKAKILAKLNNDPDSYDKALSKLVYDELLMYAELLLRCRS